MTNSPGAETIVKCSIGEVDGSERSAVMRVTQVLGLCCGRKGILQNASGRRKIMNPAYRPMLATLVNEPFNDKASISRSSEMPFHLVTRSAAMERRPFSLPIVAERSQSLAERLGLASAILNPGSGRPSAVEAYAPFTFPA